MTATLTSLLKDPSGRKPAIAPAKISSHWKLLKSLINTDDEENDKHAKGIDVDKFPKVISHGIHYQGKMNIGSAGQTLKFVALNSALDCYATLNDKGKITVVFSSGKIKRLKSDARYNGMIFSTKSKQCICWGDSEKLKLMNESFKPVSTSQSVAVIHCAVYNISTHEVITAGDGNITCWSFRYGGKYLMPRKVITDNLENCTVSGICLEDSLSKSQRCFISTGTSIASFNALEGKCLSFLKNRHAQKITCLVFFNPLKYLISAAKDGSIKVWNDNGALEIAFVGHHGSVNGLAIYPFGQFIVSASTDKTLRVWSLEAKDEVDKIQCEYPVEGIGTVIGDDNLYSFTSQGIDLWKIKHIHTARTSIGCKVKNLKQTTHPKFPLRIVSICADAAVRIVSGKTGDVITTSLVPDLTTITDAVYLAGEDLLFTLLVNGKIVKSSTATNPSSLLEVWECKDLTSPCSCLCLYEYIFEHILGGTSWLNIIEVAKAEQIKTSLAADSNDRTLLLGGCINGYIVVFDWKDKKNPGRVVFKIEAHRDEIVSMISNPKIDQVVSSGLDNIIKIWRLFPFAEEALAPLMTLYFDELPRHLCVSHHRLLVALYERSRASYAVTIYKTTQKERFDHSSEDDHIDEVIGVSSCLKMRLFATASLDGTVRIWDESNDLKRVIKLNATPSALCFCSERGDIMVAIGNSLHKIKYATYLPQSYIYRMVGMEFRDCDNDSIIPIDETLLKSLSALDQQRLTKAHSYSSPFTHAPDPMEDEESDEKKQEAKRREVAMEKIQKRENDLKKLRDGELRGLKKKPKMDENLQNEAFEKYFSLFYNRTSVTLPDNSDDEDELPVYKEKDVYVPDLEPGGFFCIDPQSPLKYKNEEEADSGERESLDVENIGIPNRLRSQSLPIINEEPCLEYDKNIVLEDTSVELSGERTQSPTVTETDQNKPGKKRKSSSAGKNKCKHRVRKQIIVGKSPGSYPLPVEELKEISRESTELAMVEDENGKQYEAIVIAPDGYIPNSVVAALFDDMRSKKEIEVKQEEVVPWRPPQLTLTQLLEIQKSASKAPISEVSSEDDILSKVNKIDYEEQLRRVLRDTPSPETFSDEEFILPPDSPPEQTPKKNIPVLTPAEYFAARDPLRSPLPLSRKGTSPLCQPTDEPASPMLPAREPSPVPQPYVKSRTPSLQTAEQAPLPHFITQFKGMRWFDTLFPKANPSTFPKPWTIDAFVGLLLLFLSKRPDYEMKQHICAAIILLRGQESFDDYCVRQIIDTLTQELNISSGSMATCDSNMKQFIRSALHLLRLTKKYSRSVVAVFMSHFILGDEEIRSMVIDIFTEIGVQEANRFFLRELDDFDVWGVPENAVKAHVHRLCVNWLDKWLAQFKEHIRSFAGKINRAHSGQIVRGTKNPKTPSQFKGILKSRESKSNVKHAGVSWNFQTLGDVAAENVSSVDAINYFSEMQLQSEIEKARARKYSLKRTSLPEEEKARNTVLILPSLDTKPSLARLGETHCSHCHPERETALSYGFPLPPIHQQTSLVVNNIALRLKTITLNPFPSKNDAKIYESFQHHELLTLRSAQKYFIPSRSYVQPESVK